MLEEGEVGHGVVAVEDGGSRDHEVGLHRGNLINRFPFDRAIDTDEDVGLERAELCDLCGKVIEEGLLPGVGAHAEDEDVVDLVEVGSDCLDRGAGIEGSAADDVIVFRDETEGGPDLVGIFHAKGDEVGPGLGEGGDVLFRFVDEEVDVLQELGFESGHERRADGDGGPDHSVHDIEVQKADPIFDEGLEGGILVADVGGEGGDRELGLGADEGDLFGAGHWGFLSGGG